MKHNWVVILVFSFSLNSCMQESNDKLDTIHIDFSLAASQVRLSEIIDLDIEIIPLETFNDHGDLIFLQRLNKVEFTNNHIYIMDSEVAQSLLKFDKKGQFLQKIGAQGNSPFEYLQIMDFAILEDTVEVLDYKRVLIYSSKGDFLKGQRIPDLAPSRFSPLSDHYAFIGSQAGVDNLLLADDQFELQKSFFPYTSRAFNVGIPDPLIFNSKSELIHRRFSSDTLYKISHDLELVPYLFIDYGENKVDHDFILSQPEPEIYFGQNRSNFCLTLLFRESANYRYLSFVYKGERWDYIESHISGKSILFKKENLIDDITFDPISSLVDVYGDYFIFTGNPGRILPAIENINLSEDTPSHIRELKELSKKISPEDNTILFGVKFDF